MQDDHTTTKTTEIPRAVLNGRARRIAIALRTFMSDADQFVSLVRRYELTTAAIELEAFADGR